MSTIKQVSSLDIKPFKTFNLQVLCQKHSNLAIRPIYLIIRQALIFYNFNSKSYGLSDQVGLVLGLGLSVSRQHKINVGPCLWSYNLFATEHCIGLPMCGSMWRFFLSQRLLKLRSSIKPSHRLGLISILLPTSRLPMSIQLRYSVEIS